LKKYFSSLSRVVFGFLGFFLSYIFEKVLQQFEQRKMQGEQWSVGFGLK